MVRRMGPILLPSSSPPSRSPSVPWHTSGQRSLPRLTSRDIRKPCNGKQPPFFQPCVGLRKQTGIDNKQKFIRNKQDKCNQRGSRQKDHIIKQAVCSIPAIRKDKCFRTEFNKIDCDIQKTFRNSSTCFGQQQFFLQQKHKLVKQQFFLQQEFEFVKQQLIIHKKLLVPKPVKLQFRLIRKFGRLQQEQFRRWRQLQQKQLRRT